MQLTAGLKQFIRAHLTDNTDKLLLAASRFPGIDIRFAIDQIIARRQIQHKLPFWYEQDELIYPSRLSTEQCSSEQTALYKQQLLRGNTVCDLTGGLGIDTFYFAQKAGNVIYVERFPEYCTAAQHNFKVLNTSNIHIIHSDACDIIQTLQADTFYLDPARRGNGNKRLFALTDCEPDILQLKPLLLERARRVIVKISPMADPEETLRLLPETREIHILAVRNECKELLFILEGTTPSVQPVKIYAVNLGGTTAEPPFIFTPDEEKEAPLQVCQTLQNYLYEPHAALLKSGAFKLIATRLNLFKLHRHRHLYTSESLCQDFPGRIFTIEETYEFSGKLLKQLYRQIPKANLTTRNFPLTVAELRKRSNIKEGGDIYLFATTLYSGQRVLIRTHKTH